MYNARKYIMLEMCKL